MNSVLPNYVWIIIIVVAILIVLYILYLIGSNRRFHKMVDPQLQALKEYDERRRRAVQNVMQQPGENTYAEPQQVQQQVQQVPADYTWQDQDQRR